MTEQHRVHIIYFYSCIHIFFTDLRVDGGVCDSVVVHSLPLLSMSLDVQGGVCTYLTRAAKAAITFNQGVLKSHNNCINNGNSTAPLVKTPSAQNVIHTVGDITGEELSLANM